VLRLDPALLGAARREHAQDELARGGVTRLQVLPKMGLPSFGLFFRRDETERPAILSAFADAIRRVSSPLRKAGSRHQEPS
jgi:hypothetical protein